MDARLFEQIACEELARVPEPFASRVQNVAVLVEEEPSEETRNEEGLAAGETLLGLYRGVPVIDRGSFYSGVLPDTITLYRRPLMQEAHALVAAGHAATEAEAVRRAIRETLWHELGHYFGLSEGAVERREDEGTNEYPA